MLLNSGAAAKAVHPPNAAEAFKNHLRETFSSFDTKEIKLSLKRGVVKLPAARLAWCKESSVGRESRAKRQHLKYLGELASDPERFTGRSS